MSQRVGRLLGFMYCIASCLPHQWVFCLLRFSAVTILILFWCNMNLFLNFAMDKYAKSSWCIIILKLLKVLYLERYKHIHLYFWNSLLIKHIHALTHTHKINLKKNSTFFEVLALKMSNFVFCFSAFFWYQVLKYMYLIILLKWTLCFDIYYKVADYLLLVFYYFSKSISFHHQLPNNSTFPWVIPYFSDMCYV